MEELNLFEEFLGQDVKVPYKDGDQFKIARGTLKGISKGFIKIEGDLGTIIVNGKNVEKMSLLKSE